MTRCQVCGGRIGIDCGDCEAEMLAAQEAEMRQHEEAMRAQWEEAQAREFADYLPLPPEPSQ